MGWRMTATNNIVEGGTEQSWDSSLRLLRAVKHEKFPPQAMAHFDIPVSYTGCLSSPKLHPVLRSSRGTYRRSLSPNQVTRTRLSLHGKLICGKQQSVSAISWQSIASRPLVERSGPAGLECGCVVVLTEPRGAVAVLLHDTPDRAVFRPHDAIVAWEARRNFRDHAETHRMVIAPGEHSEVVWKFGYLKPLAAIWSNVGVGIRPPNVVGAPKPSSSVRITRMFGAPFGAPFGGTTRGGQADFDCRAFKLIWP